MVVRCMYPVHPPGEVGSVLWLYEGVDVEWERREV